MPSNSFYVVIPSNTNIEGNRTNSFRVRLPRKLQFNSEWEVGLAVIVYPHSWPSIGTVEQQFVQIEWQTGNTVRIEVPPSNVTNPHELSKNLYRLLGEGSDPLAKKVRSTQNSFMLTINKARRWAREEYIKRKTKEKRGVRDEEMLLQAMLTDTGTLVELNSVTHGLLAREKRAESSNVPLRIPADDDDSYQKKLDEYFSKLSEKNLTVLDELGMTKLNAEIKNLTEEERAILEATKEMGTEAWIQAYREIRLVCQFNYDVHRNRFVLNTDPRYVKKVAISPQLAYILGFNNTEFMQAEKEARFVPDMSGGVSSFHVYTPDLIEPMMIGDVTAPVLRIVTIRGNPDQSANSSACGRHVIFFLYCRCVGMTFEKIVRFLHFGKQQPDTLRKFQLKMHVDFDPLQVDWSTFSSECVQFGGYNIYRGLPYQRGAGVGAVFRSLMRYLLPIGKQIGSAIGRQGMESGNRVLTNVLEGKDLKESLVSESKVLPLATITQESPYLFRLYSDNLWTDLSRIYLYLELSIEKPGANDKWIAIEDTDTSVSATQGIGQTFVQQLKVTVGNTEVYDSGNLYPFKAYITNELSFPINAKKNFLGSTGYYHTVNQDDSTDEGFKERCKIFKGGKNAQFLSRLDFDLGNQELYLLNNLDLLFTIYKAKDVFLLQTLKANDATKYRLTVHDVKIYAKMVEVQPSLNMSLYKTLEKQPATYAVRKTEIKSSFISVGRYEFEYNVFSATIPRRVTIALVGNSAFHGDYKLSPFMFEPFDLREISIHAGGVVYPAVPYKLNFSKDHFVSAFVDMYEALGMANSERSLTFQWPSSRKAVEKRYNKRTSHIQFTNSTWWRGDDCLGQTILKSVSFFFVIHFIKMPPSENSDRPIQPPGNVQPVQQPHQQPDSETELRAQIEDAEEDLLLNWWREDPTIVSLFIFFFDTIEHLPSKPRFFSALNVRPRSCANTPRTNNEKGETKIIVAIIPPPPKLNGERISPQAPF
ncbi:hypothetical protein niasHT_039120 [Heterodera trifolii]|uniref:Uncharacterized protein n=1 Tax=Heterodera trifolii TaxID=157864 RepID=A0ABD2IGD2_9BILA